MYDVGMFDVGTYMSFSVCSQRILPPPSSKRGFKKKKKKKRKEKEKKATVHARNPSERYSGTVRYGTYLLFSWDGWMDGWMDGWIPNSTLLSSTVLCDTHTIVVQYYLLYRHDPVKYIHMYGMGWDGMGWDGMYCLVLYPMVDRLGLLLLLLLLLLGALLGVCCCWAGVGRGGEGGREGKGEGGRGKGGEEGSATFFSAQKAVIEIDTERQNRQTDRQPG